MNLNENPYIQFNFWGGEKKKDKEFILEKKKRSIKIKLKQFVRCAVTINQIEFHLGPLGIMIAYIF